MYYQVNLTNNTLIGSPIDLPTFLVGLQPTSLEDLSWADPALSFTDSGLWVIISQPLPIDTTKQVLDGVVHYVADPETKTVNEFQGVRDMNADELAAIQTQIQTVQHNDLVAAQTNKCQAIDDFKYNLINQGMTFSGKLFQIDDVSRGTITGAAVLASLFLQQHPTTDETGNLRWASASKDFGWITADNDVLLMDAQTTIIFGQAAAGIYSEIVFFARDLKNEVLALTDVDSVNNFDIASQSWPSTKVS